MPGSDVTLYMYDISRGMARQMAPALGMQLEAIWHTSVVAFGREYYYVGGAGVLDSVPEGTQFGQPIEKRPMGCTQKRQSEFESWNRDQERGRFGPEGYDLLNNNCNHYSNEALLFLVNQRTPDTVYNLTQSILSSPIGQMVAPFLQAMTGPMSSMAMGMQNMGQPQPPRTGQPAAAAAGGGQRGASATQGGVYHRPAGNSSGSHSPAERAAPARPRYEYWCHMCDRKVAIQQLANGERRCAVCKEEFIEQMEVEGSGEAAPEAEAEAEADPRAYDPSVNAERQPTGAPSRMAADPSAGGQLPTGNGGELPVDMIMQALGQGLASLQQAATAGQDATFNMPADSPLTQLVGGMARGVQQLLQRVPPGMRQHLSNQRISELPRSRLSAEAAAAATEPCVICHDEFVEGSEVITLACGHFFHADCITEWLRHRSNCPTCRAEV